LEYRCRELELEVHTLRRRVGELVSTQQLLSGRLLDATKDGKKNNGVIKNKDNEIKRKYELCVILLGQKEEEIQQLSQDLMDLKKIYRQQVSALVDTIEELKRGKI
jgi:hypothetical protein